MLQSTRQLSLYLFFLFLYLSLDEASSQLIYNMLHHGRAEARVEDKQDRRAFVEEELGQLPLSLPHALARRSCTLSLTNLSPSCRAKAYSPAVCVFVFLFTYAYAYVLARVRVCVTVCSRVSVPAVRKPSSL